MAKPRIELEKSNDGARSPLSPLVEVVARSLRTEIARGKYPLGLALPSERALSEHHRVSRTVVREAVATLAQEGLLIQSERCRPIVASLRHPRRHEGALRFGVWLWPQTDDYVASTIFRGIQQAGRGTDVRFIVGTASHHSWDDDIESEARFIRQLVDHEAADGILLWYIGGQRNLPVLQEARQKGLEFVFIDRRPPIGFEADYVGTENMGAARATVAHLIDFGHRKIAFVANLDDASSVGERERGYRRALEDAGLEADPRWRLRFSPEVGELESVAARRLAQELLALSPRPTAVFAVNDNVATALLEALREISVAVPEEISIAGFDGVPSWAPGRGPLTSVRQNFPLIGEHAGEALLSRLAASSQSYRHVLLDAPLIAGSSTGPAPAELSQPVNSL